MSQTTIHRPTIALHLGVHKTATTYFQAVLAENKETLCSLGIGYVELPVVRKHLTRRIKDTTWDGASFFNEIGSLAGFNRLIISDENILGMTSPPVVDIYRYAEVRLNRVKKIFEKFPVEIHVTVRDYADYLISRYSEFLRHYDFLTFSQYYSQLDFPNIDWETLISTLSRTFDVPITVYDFESIVGNNRLFFREILKENETALREPKVDHQIRRSKISRETYGVLKMLAQEYSPAVTSSVLRTLEKVGQRSRVSSFAPLAPKATEILSQRYHHLKEDLAKAERVRFVSKLS